jgi:hypothetical protein
MIHPGPFKRQDFLIHHLNPCPPIRDTAPTDPASRGLAAWHSGRGVLAFGAWRPGIPGVAP